VDKDQRALSQQGEAICTISADFTKPIAKLPELDGLLVANALHFVRNQSAVIAQLASYLKNGGSFVVVEYAVKLPRGFIPNPLPYEKFERLATETGLVNIHQIGSRTSPTNSMTMYAAHATKIGDIT
jgi:hypothetical protein